MTNDNNRNWDDVPAKIVGKRRTDEVESKAGYQLQELANHLSQSRVTWPKGVFRFRSHEQAEKWWTEKMIIRK